VKQQQQFTPKRYWRRSLWLVVAGLLVWFLVTVLPLLFAPIGAQGRLFGWPWLFAVAAFAVPLVYLLIIGVYALLMDRLDRDSCDAGPER
jgi:putative solute:sodium symporter small subunit